MDEISKFIGRWIDHTGHIIDIKRTDNFEVQVDFYPSLDGQPIERMLLGRTAVSLNMKGILIKDLLQVELGKEGLGPTLELTPLLNEERIFLKPEVVMGLYDDFEDDFGVPWIFPLFYYKRI